MLPELSRRTFLPSRAPPVQRHSSADPSADWKRPVMREREGLFRAGYLNALTV
jgi:hypothetical protein